MFGVSVIKNLSKYAITEIEKKIKERMEKINTRQENILATLICLETQEQ